MNSWAPERRCIKTKRLNVQFGGNLENGYRVRAELLPYAPPNSSRGVKSAVSSLKKELQNCKTSWFKLELILYENFSLDDWFVTLTYNPHSLPPSWRAAKKNPPRFLSSIRVERKKRGQPYGYVYVNECLHGDGRPNHHCVIKAGMESKSEIEDLWSRGFVEIKTIRDFGGFQKLAKYMTKEPREKGKVCLGERMWNPSHGLSRPTTISVLVDDSYMFNQPDKSEPIAEGLAIQSTVPAWPFGEFPRWDMISPEIQTIYNLFDLKQ